MCRSSAVARQATAVFDELGMLNAERDRLTPDGIPGVATITGIGQNVATTALDTWHELVLEVRLPNRDPYRATRLVSVELSTASHIRVGAELGVLVDPQDRSKVLVVASLYLCGWWSRPSGIPLGEPPQDRRRMLDAALACS